MSCTLPCFQGCPAWLHRSYKIKVKVGYQDLSETLNQIFLLKQIFLKVAGDFVHERAGNLRLRV